MIVKLYIVKTLSLPESIMEPQHLVLTLDPLDETPLSVLSHGTICFQYYTKWNFDFFVNNVFILSEHFWKWRVKTGLSAGTGKLCIFGHLGLVFIWSCFVSCLLLLLYYVICAPVLTEGTVKTSITLHTSMSIPAVLLA